MPPLPLIARLDNYTSDTWDLATDAEARDYWLNHFREHSRLIMPLLKESFQAEPEYASQHAEQFIQDLIAGTEQRQRYPEKFPQLGILELDLFRMELIEKHGFGDPYERIKLRENKSATQLYPSVISELAEHRDDQDLALAMVQGVFAGNIFDMGSIAAARDYDTNGNDFLSVRGQLCDRPWLVDDLDQFIGRLCSKTYRKVLFFVDNAGSDIILGCMPIARQMALWGAKVILAANSKPVLNDITYRELKQVLDDLTDIDGPLAELVSDGRIAVIDSGSATPLIDLSKVSAQCCDAARGVDLLVLEGMGRAIESNYNASFNCDCLKIALLKDQFIAHKFGGSMYDCVCRFEQA